MRAEPWPIAIAGLLSGMIAVCLVFWAIAIRHADVELLADSARPGLTAGAAPERVDGGR
jgi:hypothetical protein